MHEVGCAVDGVDDEGWGGGDGGLAGDVGFFANKGERGVGGAQAGGDVGFDGAVGFGYDVDV